MTSPQAPDHAALTAQVLALVEQGRADDAAEVALRAYGGAIFGYMRAMIGDPDAADDAMQQCALRVWRGIGGFGGRSSLKTWLLRVAHNAALRALEDPHRRRAQPLASEDEARLVARWSRTATDAWRQTGEKQRLWQAVESLGAEDRALLSLRLQQGMAWRDIAQALSQSDDAAALTADAARLRKRFERLKDALRQRLGGPRGDGDGAG
jgi:RNA polymerase sigma-70 factor (ECF subfamily)